MLGCVYTTFYLHGRYLRGAEQRGEKKGVAFRPLLPLLVYESIVASRIVVGGW